MIGGGAENRRARAAAEDEETRYRAVAELDGADDEDREVLLERLADPSWRVRAAAVDRIAAGAGAAAALEGLVRVLAVGPGVGAREAAAAALARIGAPAVPLLVERLSGTDADLRQAAAGVLGAIADRRAVAPLTAQLAHPDPNVRAAAADALGKVGGPGALSALRGAADSDDPALRLSAIEALAAMRASLPARRIEELLEDRSLRRALYRMIGACDDLAAVALVARGVANPSRAGREAALAALGQQRARRTAEELSAAMAGIRAAAVRAPGLADAWAGALASEEPFATVGALTALAAAGAGRHGGALVKLADDVRLRALVEEALEALPQGAELRTALADALPSLGQLSRITALAALARLGSPAAFESVVREASDGASYVQSEAISALGRLGDARGVAPLAGLLGDDDAGTGALASAALVRIGQSGADGCEAVLAAVRGRAEASASAAAHRTLGALGGADDVGLLEAGLRAAATNERTAAAAALGALAHRGLVGARLLPGVLAALGDPAWGVRAAAARTIGEVAQALLRPNPGERDEPREQARSALAAALRDPEDAVCAAAAEALGACGELRHAEELASLAADPEATPVVVVAALHALAALGATSVPALERAIRHEDPEVVKEAVLGAVRVPGAEGVRLLRLVAASAHWDVRRAVARAMEERADWTLLPDAERLAAADPDPLVAHAFAAAARALGGR